MPPLPTPAPAPIVPDPKAQFVALSAALTGFDAASLHGTGMVETYYDTLTGIVGEGIVGRLLGAWSRVAAGAGNDPDALDSLIRAAILGNPTFGPVVRNVITMWYMGMWTQLPGDWRNAHGANARDLTHIISSEAYVQGLVWDAIGTHPQGAKQAGYGSWALPPKGAPPA